MQCSSIWNPCCAFPTTRHSHGLIYSVPTSPLASFRSYNSGHTAFRHKLTSRNKPGRLVCTANRDTKRQRLHKKQQVEKSNMVHSELIYFMFQMNLDTQLQRTLNMDNFDTAQEIRRRRKEIDDVVAEQLESKGPGCGSRSANQTAVADVASEGLRLRSELQRAIDEERYSDAAEVRDRLKLVQEQSEKAQTEAASIDQPARKYQLGQRVRHAKLDYDGVICGWDNCCCEDVEWQKAAQVAELDGGREQAFYHVLVDAKDWEASWERPPVAYVAEELLHAPEEPQTWPEVYGYNSFDHVYLYTLFLGRDARGNMLPVRQLRDRYSQQRQDVYPTEDPPEEDDTQDPLAES